ncbi:MAG: ketol-acid reductoisomerase [Euryarchaeota archaeon]
MAKIYGDEDASLDVLEGRTVAVIGYGNQGEAQAKNLRDSGVDVIIGVREGGPSWKRAREDGFEVLPIPEAAEQGDVVHILIPDEVQPRVYREQIHDHLNEGDALGFSHAFNVHYGLIEPPEYVDVILVAPKGPGHMVRKLYTEGFGTPALIAVHQDYTGRAKDLALAMAKAMGFTRAGVIETTFREEVETDLFGEQVDLVGGVLYLILYAFETLVEAGYQPEVAYFETLHELKLIVDLIHERGLSGMLEAVSNTAEYGGLTRGKRIINKEEMKKVLKEIQTGKFAREWTMENESGRIVLRRLREEIKDHEIERVGRRLRKMMGFED